MFKTRGRRLGIVIASVGLAAVVVLVAGWFWIGSGEAAEEFEASDLTAGGSGETEDVSGSTTSEPGQASPLEGKWVVSLQDGSDLGVGYRILEDLPVGGPEEITSRTTAVMGSIELEGSALEAAEITIDVAQLRSGNDLRDGIVAADYLEAEQFPTATVSMDEPATIEFPDESGELVEFSVPADMTMHGVTQPVTVNGDGQWAQIGGETVIEIVGTVDTSLSAFDVERPGLAGRSTRDEVVVEFKLRFSHESNQQGSAQDPAGG